jgi:hypothetical protein
MDAHQLNMALRDVDYPAGKEELIRAAEAAGAPEEVMRALRAIPPEVYRNREEVARSIPDNPAEELGVTPAQRAEQARERRRHGGEHLSHYLREVPKPRWRRNWTGETHADGLAASFWPQHRRPTCTPRSIRTCPWSGRSRLAPPRAVRSACAWAQNGSTSGSA